MPNEGHKRDREYLSIPMGFVKILSVVMALSVAWFPWATVTLIRMQLHYEQADKKFDILAQQIKVLNDHVTDPELHHARFNLIESTIMRNEQAIERLVKNIDKLLDQMTGQ